MTIFNLIFYDSINIYFISWMCCYLFLNLKVNFSWPSWTSKYVKSSWNTLYTNFQIVSTKNKSEKTQPHWFQLVKNSRKFVKTKFIFRFCIHWTASPLNSFTTRLNSLFKGFWRLPDDCLMTVPWLSDDFICTYLN